MSWSDQQKFEAGKERDVTVVLSGRELDGEAGIYPKTVKSMCFGHANPTARVFHVMASFNSSSVINM